jgi:hypothetical protein
LFDDPSSHDLIQSPNVEVHAFALLHTYR